MEESTEGMGSGDRDEAEVGDAKEDCKVGRVVGVCRVVRRADRRLMMKLSGGTTGFQIETAGRWRRATRQERVCKECDSGEVEDVDRLMRCEAWKSQRGLFIRSLDETPQ